jgi:hypothetical protein
MESLTANNVLTVWHSEAHESHRAQRSDRLVHAAITAARVSSTVCVRCGRGLAAVLLPRRPPPYLMTKSCNAMNLPDFGQMLQGWINEVASFLHIDRQSAADACPLVRGVRKRSKLVGVGRGLLIYRNTVPVEIKYAVHVFAGEIRRPNQIWGSRRRIITSGAAACCSGVCPRRCRGSRGWFGRAAVLPVVEFLHHCDGGAEQPIQ